MSCLENDSKSEPYSLDKVIFKCHQLVIWKFVIVSGRWTVFDARVVTCHSEEEPSLRRRQLRSISHVAACCLHIDAIARVVEIMARTRKSRRLQVLVIVLNTVVLVTDHRTVHQRQAKW